MISKSKYGFRSVCGVAVDKDDNIYVSDSINNCLYKFNKSRELLKRFGKKGSGPGKFDRPRGFEGWQWLVIKCLCVIVTIVEFKC